MMVEIGEAVPQMNLVDTELKPVALSELKGKPAIIAFFPGAFTGVCTRELCTFRDSIAKLSGLGARLVAISVDSPFSNKAFKQSNRLGFQLLSDYNREAVKRFGIELRDFAAMKGYTAAKRAVFITDKDGIIRYKWVSDDPTKEPDYGVVMAEAEKAGR